MARHVYVDPSKFRAPLNYPNLTLTGLGEPLRQNWPAGRRYVDVSRFRAPYLSYEFQTNELFGVGDPPPSQPLPEALQAYLRTGAPMSTIRRDLGSALGQVPRIVWGLSAALAGFVTYKAWKRLSADSRPRHAPAGT